MSVLDSVENEECSSIEKNDIQNGSEAIKTPSITEVEILM